jgi:hypothetical protein
MAEELREIQAVSLPAIDPNPDETEDQKKQVDFLRLYIDRKIE